MLKLVAFLKRRNGLALEAFHEHWREPVSSVEYGAVRADEKNFMISGRLPFVITEAHEIEVR
jgi:hypothetical protein